MRFIQVGGPTSHECMHEKCHMVLTNGKWKFRFVVTTIISIIIFIRRFTRHPGGHNFPDDDIKNRMYNKAQCRCIRVYFR